MITLPNKEEAIDINFLKATLHEILERGWQQGSLYSRFTNKVCLLGAVYSSVDQGLLEKVAYGIAAGDFFKGIKFMSQKTIMPYLGKEILNDEGIALWDDKSVSITMWNDKPGRTQEDVMCLLETAINDRGGFI